MFKSLLLLFILLFCQQWVIGQQDSPANEPKQIQFDQEPIEKTVFEPDFFDRYIGDREFDYQENLITDNWYTRLKARINNLWWGFWKWLLGNKTAGGFLKLVLEVLPYLMLLIILGLLIWLLSRISPGPSGAGEVNKGYFSTGNDEEILSHQDIRALVEDALREQNYRLAVRYYYLFILQQLTFKELIDWQVQKTNHDYLTEIPVKDLRDQFRILTELYDFIWYGSFMLDAKGYSKVEKAFLKMEGKI